MSPASVNLDVLPGVEYPPKADLTKEIYQPLPKIEGGIIDPALMTDGKATLLARTALDAFNKALASNDAKKLASCFYEDQAFWRDMVALTSHLRTFALSHVVASALLETMALRGIAGSIELTGDAHFTEVNPGLMFIKCEISFSTSSPALQCSGHIILLPVQGDANEGPVLWKIWILSTWVESLTQHPENDTLLSSPGRKLDGVDPIETDVFIVGGGSSGLTIAARLKALGVESVVVDRIAEVGDTWAHRYDCLQLHVPTSSCELPYVRYKKELQTPHLLNKYEIAEHLRHFAAKFHLNTILSTTVASTIYDPSEKKWTVKLKGKDGDVSRTIISKHLVQATGIGSRCPYLPSIEDEHLYRGSIIHSTQYRNSQILADQGIKSVAIIGSANTAFDVMEDCYGAGLKSTMVVRSPTYVLPYDYVMSRSAFGVYDVMPLDQADRLVNTLPLGVDGQLSRGLLARLASQEPDRYLALSQAGFPVLDSRDPSVDLQSNLLERAGGHYLDTGGSRLIAEGKVAVRGNVQPVAYTETGLRLSDGSTLDVDAVIWCTGFADKDVRGTVKQVLGAGDSGEADKEKGQLGVAEIAARLDASWGVDVEGEVRGMWKRHLRMENFWVMGGAFLQQRWWSKPLAQQIRLALDGCLPPAYRDTPCSS